MPFDFRLLSGAGVFAAVVEAGTFVAAGEALGLTQSGVSRAIARLEERLGTRLLHRTARSVALTEEGRRFYDEVMPHLAGIEEASQSVSGSAAAVRGRLRVNVDGAFGPYVLAPNLERFLTRYPEIRFELAVRDRLGDLVAEGFDFAIHFGEPEPSALTARQLLRARILTCASPGYLARHGVPRHPRELEQGHQCVLLRNPATGRPYGWEFHRGTERVAVAASGTLMVNETAALMGACLGGQGMAQPLGLYAERYIREGALVQVLPDWSDETFPLYVYHRAQHLMPLRIRAFLDFLVELTAGYRTGGS